MKSVLILSLIGAAGFALGYASNPQKASTTSSRHTMEELEAVLRKGSRQSSLAALEKFAKEDPHGFLKSSGRFARIEGLSSIIQTAARGLASENPEKAAVTLNTIGSDRNRWIAWRAFMESIGGSVSERILIARQSRDPDRLVMQAVIEPAMSADSEGTLAALRTAGHHGEYGSALAILSRTDSDQAIAKLKDVTDQGWMNYHQVRATLDKILQDRGPEVLVPVTNGLALSEDPEALTSVVPDGLIKSGGTTWHTTLALKSVANWVQSDSYPDGLGLESVFIDAFHVAHDAETLEAIRMLPEMRKNLVLSRINLGNFNEEMMASVIDALDSPELQQDAITRWVESKSSDPHPDQIRKLAEKIKSPSARAALETLGKEPGE